MSGPRFAGLECIRCGERAHTIPVWEDIRDYEDGSFPDYVGCTNCHNMFSTTPEMIEKYYES